MNENPIAGKVKEKNALKKIFNVAATACYKKINIMYMIDIYIKVKRPGIYFSSCEKVSVVYFSLW